MKDWARIALLMATIVALTTATTITLDKNYTASERAYDVDSLGIVTVIGVGNGVNTARATFRSFSTMSCTGMCYEIRSASFSNGKAALSISGGNNMHTFKANNIFLGRGCSKASALAVTARGDNTGSDEYHSFDFELDISLFCDDRSISFQEAADNNPGFQYGDAVKQRIMTEYVKGLCLGLALALMWLTVLFGAVFYLRCRPTVWQRPYVPEAESVPLTSVKSEYVGK